MTADIIFCRHWLYSGEVVETDICDACGCYVRMVFDPVTHEVVTAEWIEMVDR